MEGHAMKIRTVSTIAAMVFGATMSAAIAQTTPQPSTQPSPTTPPTHPTERATQGAPDRGTTGSTNKKGAGGIDEAMQACKNMSGEAAQRDCMKKAQDDVKKSKGSAPQTKY
jgi:hypothetical protein